MVSIKNNNKARMPHRFRCQYQKDGIDDVSDTFESIDSITSDDIMLSLARLAVKVKNEINEDIGGRVALKVLEIHEFIIKNFTNMDNDGFCKSFKFDDTAKNTKDRSERVDIEIRGKYTSQSHDNVMSNYIELYRKQKGWT